MNDYLSIVSTVVSSYKNGVEKECVRKLTEAINIYLEKENECRRAKKTELIMRAVDLKLKLDNLKFAYSKVVAELGDCSSLKKYIQEKDLEVKKLLLEKNRK